MIEMSKTLSKLFSIMKLHIFYTYKLYILFCYIQSAKQENVYSELKC